MTNTDKGDRAHTDECPNRSDAGYVMALIKCPECDTHGWHPTKRCDQCGHALCWCVGEDTDDSV